jgi:putative peptidoglycan lipid II flippase
MSLARNVIVQSSFTLGSRILGFARDLALNARFGGQGPLMDAWATAQMLPNLFRRLFAEGAFAQAFVPLFARERAEAGDEAAAKLASQALSFILALVAALCILLQVLMPWMTPALLSAYRGDPSVMGVAALMAQLAMPYLACMTLASLLSGVLNTFGRFALSAGAPILLNLCTLVPLLVVSDAETAALAACASVSLAGVLQCALLWWGVRRTGMRLSVSAPAATLAVRRLLKLAIPGAVAGGAIQLNTLISQVLSGSDAGARAVLYNADRLYQLPLGLIGVAVGLALVPRLSRFFASDDRASADRTMDDGLVLSMAFTLPAAAALAVAPYMIIDGIVTRGAFTSQDAARTADVLRHFAWGVPAFVLAKVLTPPFFARQNTSLPMRFALIAVAVNTLIGACLWFLLPMFGMDGAMGLAIGTSAAGWLNVILLLSALARQGVYRVGASAVRRLARLAAACAVMTAALALGAAAYPLLSSVLGMKELAVMAATGVGAAIYAAAALGFRAVSVAEIRAALRRERGAPAGDLPGPAEG